jgi:hypothetical protein
MTRRVSKYSIVSRLLSTMLLSLAGGFASIAAAQNVTITVDPLQSTHRYAGHGFQVWVPSRTADQRALLALLESTRARYVRLSMFPNSVLGDKATGRPYSALLEAIRASYLASPRAGDPAPIITLKSFVGSLKRLDVEAIAINWNAPQELRRDRALPGGKVSKQLDPGKVPAFARYISAEIRVLGELDRALLPRYVEVVNEPDGNWNTQITPEGYAQLVADLQGLFREQGLSGVGILGPGTATMRAGVPYIEKGMSVAGRQTYSGLSGISVHAWDSRSGGVDGVAGIPTGLVRISRELGLPVFVTEYNEDSSKWSPPAFACGPRTPVSARCTGTTGYDAVGYGVAVVAQALKLISDGASALVFWEAQDQSWGRSYGALRADGRRKPSADALTTILPLIDRDATVQTTRQSPDNVKGIYAAGFKNHDGKIMVVVAITGTTARTMEINVRGAGTDSSLHPVQIRCYPQCPPNSIARQGGERQATGKVTMWTEPGVMAVTFGP